MYSITFLVSEQNIFSYNIQYYDFYIRVKSIPDPIRVK
jgi:hypothetical protein